MIFVDTGPFLGRYIANDQFHLKSLEGWEKIKEQGFKCYTSNFVLNEFFTLLGRSAGNKFATERARNVLTSQAFEILRPDPDDEINALQPFLKLADKHISYTDCLSFVLMKRKGIKRVFTFDQHFRHAGFDVF